MITLHYDDGGIPRTLDLAADSLRDLAPIFKRYVKWLRPEIDKVFQQQGPGWAPIAESTQEARNQQLTSGLAEKIRTGTQESLSKRLVGEQRKVLRRLEARRAEGGKAFERAQRAAGRQERIRAEFERLRAGAEGPSERAASKVAERVGRASERAETKIDKLKSGHLLGAIANSISSEIKGSSLEVFSRIPWAGVHNDGGTAGRGARIPERRFLEWNPERVAMLAKIAEEYALEKLKSG